MPEVTEPTFASRTSTSVSYGVPFAPLTKTHLDRLGAKTVFIFVSASLHKNHPEQLDALRKELGDDRIVGEKIGIAPHSPWSEILEVSKQVFVIHTQNPEPLYLFGIIMLIWCVWGKKKGQNATRKRSSL